MNRKQVVMTGIMIMRGHSTLGSMVLVMYVMVEMIHTRICDNQDTKRKSSITSVTLTRNSNKIEASRLGTDNQSANRTSMAATRWHVERRPGG